MSAEGQNDVLEAAEATYSLKVASMAMNFGKSAARGLALFLAALKLDGSTIPWVVPALPLLAWCAFEVHTFARGYAAARRMRDSIRLLKGG
jgi:hypothetical protein